MEHKANERSAEARSRDAEAATPSPRWGWLRRLLPWGSLVLAIVSAVSMDRRPERARLIAAAAVAGWLALGAVALLDRLDLARLGRSGAWLAKAVRASTAMGAQSLIQLCLFFSLPFYVRATAVPEQYGFVGVLALAAAVTLWTPLCSAVLRRPALALLLQGTAAFAALGCVLPLVGVSIRFSLVAAAAAVVVGAPFVVTRHRLVATLVTAVALTGAALGGAARLIPPAPLRFVSGAIGTRLVNRALVDARDAFDAPVERLVCLTAIAAPRGLKDRLRHVWHRDGQRRAEAALEIRGGRAQGFRAWSTQRSPTVGSWTCTVETETGQELGRVAVTVN
jgi:hypothetical protein